MTQVEVSVRAFLIVVSNLEVGKNQGIGSILGLDNSFKLHVPTLRKMGIFKCAGENEEFLPSICDYGKISVKNLTVFEQRGQMIGDNSIMNYDSFSAEIPESICNLIKDIFRSRPLYCKRGDFQSAVKECGDSAKTYSSPIVYTADNESVIKIAVHESCYKVEEFFELVKMVRESLREYNVYNIEGKFFAGNLGDYYKTQHKRAFKKLSCENNLLTKLAEKGVKRISVGKVQDYVDGNCFDENYVAKTDVLALKTLDRLAKRKENMFVYVDLSDFGKIHIAHSDMLSARLCLESIDQTMANILPSLKEGDLLIFTSDYNFQDMNACVPILIYQHNKAGNVEDLGELEDFKGINERFEKHFCL